MKLFLSLQQQPGSVPHLMENAVAPEVKLNIPSHLHNNVRVNSKTLTNIVFVLFFLKDSPGMVLKICF